MDILKSKVVQKKYTYSDIAKPAKRFMMEKSGISELGTQSGGFGEFESHFKVVSNNSISKLEKEVLTACDNDQSKLSALINACPTLGAILK